jgi:hypothetical protein
LVSPECWRTQGWEQVCRDGSIALNAAKKPSAECIAVGRAAYRAEVGYG